LGSDHVRVADCHIDGFLNGILITPGYGANAVRHTFTNVSVYTAGDNVVDMVDYPGNACLLQGQQSGGNISQIVFTSCYFELGETATPTTTVPGILVDGSISTIDTVRFISCHSLRWPGPGLEIIGDVENPDLAGPANVEVLGGMYSGNLYMGHGFTSGDAYGIHIGKSEGVRVSGVSCVGKYSYIEIGGSPSSSPQQSNGIYIDNGATDVVVSGCDLRNNTDTGGTVLAGASDVIVDACDLRGNGNNGAKIDGSGGTVSDIYIRNCNATGYSAYNVAINISSVTSNQGTVQVTNCAGYNDAQADLGTTVSNATTFYGYGLAYWGPIEFYAANSVGQTITAISVNGHTTPLKTGSFYLQPGEGAEITWTPGTSPINFLALGK
jgi:hypothetical protein